MGNLISNLHYVEELVLIIGASTPVTSKAGFQMPEHARTVGYDNQFFVYKKCASVAMGGLQKARSEVRVRKIVESKIAVAVSESFVKKLAYLTSRKSDDSWTMTAGRVPVRTFSMHMKHVVGNMYKDTTLFEKRRRKFLLKSSDKWRRRFYVMDVINLLALELSVQRKPLQQSTISHSNSETELFAGCIVGKREDACYYQRLLVNSIKITEREKKEDLRRGSDPGVFRISSKESE